MRRLAVTSLICSCTLLAACSRVNTASSGATPHPVTDQSPAETKPPVDACALLSSGEIEATQGQPVQETKPSQQTSGSFTVSQCYFTLPTQSNSVVLTVTQPAPGVNTAEVKKSWEQMFGEGNKERKGEREREREAEGEEERKPLKLEGLGEEAFWIGGHIGGAVYALKGNSYIRISVGGASDFNVKMSKAKTLSECVLKRLP